MLKFLFAVVVATAAFTLISAANAAPPPEVTQARAALKAKRAELKALRAAGAADRDAKALAKAQADLAKVETQLARARAAGVAK